MSRVLKVMLQMIEEINDGNEDLDYLIECLISDLENLSDDGTQDVPNAIAYLKGRIRQG